MARRLRDRALAIYEAGRRTADERGIILADTKFEFGVEPDGRLLLIDEVMTPDSSRYWPKESYAAGRAQLFPQLEKLAQFTIEINFNFNSDVIRPESYHAVGLMADALHNPVLLGYKFLVIGHTDAVGKREYNLQLSQRRAEAIRIALIKPFGVDPSRLEAVGLGEEQLRDPAKPDSAANRRVQLINIGR